MFRLEDERIISEQYGISKSNSMKKTNSDDIRLICIPNIVTKDVIGTITYVSKKKKIK